MVFVYTYRSRWTGKAMLLLVLFTVAGSIWYESCEDAQSFSKPQRTESVWGTRDGASNGLAGESPFASARKGYAVAGVTGRWVGTIDMGASNRIQFSFNLREAGGRLSGTANFPIGEGSIENGQVVGNKLSFTTRHQVPATGQIFFAKFSGELSGATLNLTMLSEGDESNLTLSPG